MPRRNRRGALAPEINGSPEETVAELMSAMGLGHRTSIERGKGLPRVTIWDWSEERDVALVLLHQMRERGLSALFAVPCAETPGGYWVDPLYPLLI